MRHKEILCEKVKVPETRVTSYFDSEIYKQFQQTIATMGVIEPIVVVEVGPDYYLVDGLHRLMEAKNAGKTHVPAVIIPGEEKDVFLTNLFLNVLRGKQKVSELRDVVDLLFSEYKMGTDAIAEKTGMSLRFVEDLLLISKLPPQVLTAFDEGALEKGKALSLTALPDAPAQLYMFESLHGKRLTVQDWNDYIKAWLEQRVTEIVQPAEPVVPVPTTRPCDICGEQNEPKWLQVAFICSECLGTTKAALRIARAQVTAEKGAPVE